MRLSSLVSKTFGISRREAKEAIKDGKILVENKKMTKDAEVYENIELIYEKPEQKPIEYELDKFILSRNDDIIFLYKPPFMHSDRIRSGDEITISDILANFADFKGLSRLDYEADGVIAAVHKDLKINKLAKKYLAFVSGAFPAEANASWRIDADKRKKVKVITDDLSGNETHFKLIKNSNDISLVEVSLEKAARHQVRSFLAELGYPILGDTLYGGKPFERLLLHCFYYQVNDYAETSREYKDKFQFTLSVSASASSTSAWQSRIK